MRSRSPLFLLLLCIASLGFLAIPSDAHARAENKPTFAPACHAATGDDVSLGQMIADRRTAAPARDHWVCDDSDWTADQPKAWLWFDAQNWREVADGKQEPRFFFSRIARYQRISVVALDIEGGMRELSYHESGGHPFVAGPVFQVELPKVTDDTIAIVVSIERPHSVPLLTEARITHFEDNGDWTLVETLLLAFVVGMLILPLLFDITFFVALRERFVVLHAIMVIAMISYVLLAGGLVTVFGQFPIGFIAIGAPLFWAIGCGTSALFLADFLEDGSLSRTMRRILVSAGIWTITVPGLFSIQLHQTHPIDDRAYLLGFIPLILTINAAIAQALLRGSRTARFVMLAWLPILAASLERMARGLGVYSGPSTLDLIMFLATGIEVVVISLAIGDRFLDIRRERDHALNEARMLEHLSEHDPLTGLINRRALKARFADLREQGFDTFAVVDLDQFKQINDRFGHQIGDRALVACAKAISVNDDRDTIAVRLGGEEFLLLMRGPNALERAEHLRQAVPARIAADVEGLDRPVTASMGLIAMPRHSQCMLSFDELYARADQMLYQAKSAGRNKMYFERLTLFDQAPLGRIAGEAEAGTVATVGREAEIAQGKAA